VNAGQAAAPEHSERGREGVCVLERVEEARHGLGRVAAGGVDVKPGGALGTDDGAHMRLWFLPVDDRRREGGIGRGALTKERPDGLPQVRHARTARAGERRVAGRACGLPRSFPRHGAREEKREGGPTAVLQVHSDVAQASVRRTGLPSPRGRPADRGARGALEREDTTPSSIYSV
jgi:hypothetical protein